MEMLLLKGVVVLGQGIVGSAIGDLYVAIKNSTQHKEFSRFLKELDIEFDIQIIETILSDTNRSNTDVRAIQLCTDQIRDLIIEIKNEIDNVNLIFINYQYSNRYANMYYNYVGKYLWNIGGPQYHRHMKTIKKLSSRLKDRIDMFIRLASVTRCNPNMNNSLYESASTEETVVTDAA